MKWRAPKRRQVRHHLRFAFWPTLVKDNGQNYYVWLRFYWAAHMFDSSWKFAGRVWRRP